MTGNDIYDTNENGVHCKPPERPANGEYLCDGHNEVDHNEMSTSFKSGSVCRVHCSPSHSIPLHLYSMSVIECQNGAWNSTDIEFCYKSQPKRRHLLRRHRNPHKSNRRVALD